MARKNARKSKRHNCIINHVRDQAPITQNEQTFYPMPTARDFAGGQVWFRKGLTVLIMWRPPTGLIDRDGNIYAENEVHLKVAKSKPKGVSKNGTYKLYLDVEKYQYYMKDIYGNKIYGQRNKDVKISNQFPTKIKFENVPELISTTEKIRIANENQLPF